MSEYALHQSTNSPHLVKVPRPALTKVVHEVELTLVLYYNEKFPGTREGRR